MEGVHCPVCGELLDLVVYDDHNEARFLCKCNSSQLQRVLLKAKARWQQWRVKPTTPLDDWDDDVCLIDLFPKD